MEPRNLKEQIIIPALKSMGKIFCSEDYIDLLMLTAATESHLGKYVRQGLKRLNDGRARARGIYGMEPLTYFDIQKRFRKVPYEYSRAEGVNALIYNNRFSTVMARAKYWLAPGKAPKSIEDKAMYYAKYWWSGGNSDADYEKKAVKALNDYISLVPG